MKKKKENKNSYVGVIVLIYLRKREPREGKVALIPWEKIGSMLEEIAFWL
jgi:hypothetical protein